MYEQEEKERNVFIFQTFFPCDCMPLHEKCPNTDQKRLRIWAIFIQFTFPLAINLFKQIFGFMLEK